MRTRNRLTSPDGPHVARNHASRLLKLAEEGARTGTLAVDCNLGSRRQGDAGRDGYVHQEAKGGMTPRLDGLVPNKFEDYSAESLAKKTMKAANPAPCTEDMRRDRLLTVSSLWCHSENVRRTTALPRNVPFPWRPAN